MFKTFRIISILSIAVLMISACNLPSNAATQNPNDPHVVFTAEALTVQAQLTEASPATDWTRRIPLPRSA